MKLSHKKHNELYNAVSDKVMDARIKIARLQGKGGVVDYEAVDTILSRLMDEAGQAAIHVFEPPKKK